MKHKIRCQICYWKWFILGLTFETENEYYSKRFSPQFFIWCLRGVRDRFTRRLKSQQVKLNMRLPNVGVQCCCGIVVNSYFMVTTTSTSKIFTARKRSLRRLCFYTCLSVILFTGRGCLPQWMLGYTTSPWADTPRADTSPQCNACWEIRATSGRYAS